MICKLIGPMVAVYYLTYINAKDLSKTNNTIVLNNASVANVTATTISKDPNVTFHTGSYLKYSNVTFKDFMKKYQISVVHEQINKMKLKGTNMSIDDEINAFIEGTDDTDELLSLKVQSVQAKIYLQKDGRRWRPNPSYFAYREFDSFQLRERFFFLMQQSIYQCRNNMIKMQELRQKYRNTSLYKMGYLMSKTDNQCRLYAKVSYLAFHACTGARRYTIKTFYLPDVFATLERMLFILSELELLVDLINLNDRNCRIMLKKVRNDRKNAWKFVD